MSSSKKKHSRVRHPLVMGAAILTVTGLVTRIIGFFYRICPGFLGRKAWASINCCPPYWPCPFL